MELFCYLETKCLFQNLTYFIFKYTVEASNLKMNLPTSVSCFNVSLPLYYPLEYFSLILLLIFCLNYSGTRVRSTSPEVVQ